MRLTSIEEKIRAGEWGEAAKRALEFQMKVAEFWGAEDFVEVSNVHMMGDIEVMGEGGLQYLRDLVDLKAQTIVNTSTNARCFDFEKVDTLNQKSDMVRPERELISLLQKMNVMPTDTCINYQTVYQPHFGERVAWGDTGTVIYANSVLGARTNFESGPAALAASLTGRVPAYGFHLDEHRRGNILVRVEAVLKDLADWGAIGKIVGQKHQNYYSVPVFEGIKNKPTADELKHLGASLASYGSMAMFHMVGVTPEARTTEEAFAGNEPVDIITITDDDLQGIYKNYQPLSNNVNLVVFSAPHLSIYELRVLAEALEDQKIAAGMWLIITTNNEIKSLGQKLGYIQTIEKAGGIVLEGVCFYILHSIANMRMDHGWTNLVTNSAKLANIIGAHKFQPILRRTSDCIDIAINGGIKL